MMTMMTIGEKIKELRALITSRLAPLVDSDCWLLELPYYANIGDLLIWEGTERFLRGLGGVRCRYRASSATFATRAAGEDTVILLQGGGNFGDLWEGPQEFRRRVIRDYPANRVVILPQTVYYRSAETLLADAALFARHPRLTICARDTESYALLRAHFPANTALLVPDMAFFMDAFDSSFPRGAATRRVPCAFPAALFLKRGDKELDTSGEYTRALPEGGCGVETADWPSLKRRRVSVAVLRRLLGLSARLPSLFRPLADFYAARIFKPYWIKAGARFLGRYEKVYTTRLHGAILCCLLKKPFALFDNSYGKNSAFFRTWLADVEGAEMLCP
jgi:pyruvyl transferase EpsO